MSPIKTYTLNCRGLNAEIKARSVLCQIVAIRADIIFLQETPLKNDKVLMFQTPKSPIQL